MDQSDQFLHFLKVIRRGRVQCFGPHGHVGICKIHQQLPLGFIQRTLKEQSIEIIHDGLTAAKSSTQFWLDKEV